MAYTYLGIYTVVALILLTVDVHFALKAFRKPERVGRALGWSALFAAVITLAYLISVNTKSGALISVFSSLTFMGIDCMLVSLAYFAFLVTGINRRRGIRSINNAIRLFASLDIVVMFANIFTGAAVGFKLLEPVGIAYEMKTPYVIHLIFTYFMVVLTLAVLVYKSVKTPRQYRNQYLMLIAAIGVVVAINALFLFQNRDPFFTKVDCSILGYSIGLFLMYWTAYEYRENDMLNSLSRTVMENVNQGVVLFDYEDELIMYNPRAQELLRPVDFTPRMPCSRFLEACDIASLEGDRYSVQCDLEGCVPLRCDYRGLKDRGGGAIGRLFVFTDITRNTDITTGFEYARDQQYVRENDARFDPPTTVAVFDLIGLKDVNRVMGRDAGDRRIRALAKAMSRIMPREAVFLRGMEACLIAICPGMTEEEAKPCVQDVADAGGKVMYGLGTTGVETLAQALETAYRSIQMKKLLSSDSARSQALTSLVRALKEADADTEDHVRRTQRMGAMLGRRIGLTDAQLTQLELLCLLHDIGKIGIPLEILNKPGKLSEREWAVLRTHPEKGYQIAMSSDELRSIAGMILCHHERWDGRGYPKGLAGEDIPLLSRIIAIVDAYDAMVNDRCYRKAMKPEKAQEEIRANAGAQFDPRLAREFLALLEARPELAQGERVGAEERREAVQTEPQSASTGFTTPIAYSRYILDVNHTIIEVDRRFEEITGYSADEVVGKMVQFELVPMEDRAFYLVQVNRQFAHGDRAFLRHEILRKDGQRVQVACYGKRYFDSAAKQFRNEIIIFQL